MQRKVKFFDKLYDTDTLDEEINAWIENYDKELIDVKLTVIMGLIGCTSGMFSFDGKSMKTATEVVSEDREEKSDYVLYTATVIYLDRE